MTEGEREGESGLERKNPTLVDCGTGPKNRTTTVPVYR